jgi:hypothetical protein
MDVTVASDAVALLLAAGGVKELGEAAGGGLAAAIITRVKKVFGSDARSAEALDRVQRDNSAEAVRELASALAWYARRDQEFASELAAWADTGGVTQNIHAGRDAYTAARDQTINNYRAPGE